jgi:methane monooxygenase PmoA-like
MTRLTVTHEHGTAVGVAAGDVEIGRYVYGEDIPAFEAPKPYLHPIRTLAGGLVSAYRPNDHRWHKGLQMTWSHVSGQNFWGGNTYVHGQGYTPKDNVGSMRHDAFDLIELTGAELTLSEELTWVASTGEEWASERRSLRFHGVDPARGTWMLDVGSEVTTIRDEPLHLGSPTTAGRHNAGYTGWFWRGPRDLTGGEIIAADGAGGPETMGTTKSPWLAYTGEHDEVDGGATVLVFAGSTSRGRITWFVRNDPFPGVNPSPAFHEEIVLPPGESVVLAHRFVVADRIWTRAEVEAFAAEHAP